MANKTKRPFRTGQLIRLKKYHRSSSIIRGSLDRIRMILEIRDVKVSYYGIANHYRKYTFLNPDGTTGWEKWNVYEEEMYEVVSDEV